MCHLFVQYSIVFDITVFFVFRYLIPCNSNAGRAGVITYYILRRCTGPYVKTEKYGSGDRCSTLSPTYEQKFKVISVNIPYDGQKLNSLTRILSL